MNRTTFIAALLLLALAGSARAQSQSAIWHFGNGYGLDFRTGTITPPHDASLYVKPGTAVQTHPRTGALLFYTDGVRVMNREHDVMYDGNLGASRYSSTQGPLIVPAPGDTARYYIMTPGSVHHSYDNPGVNVWIVDMRLDSGRGAVVARGRRLLDDATEMLAGVRVCGEDAWWIVTHDANSDRFYTWKITASGFEPPVVSRLGPAIASGRYLDGGTGTARFSSDGSMLAAVDHHHGFVQLLRFDHATGRLFDPILVTIPRLLHPQWGRENTAFAACFSPDDSRLYVSREVLDVLQLDVRDYDSAAIARSMVSVRDAEGVATPALDMQLGPDGRIYVIAGHPAFTVDVIERPNEPAPACSLRRTVLDFRDRQKPLGLPATLSMPAAGRRPTRRAVTIRAGERVQLKATSGARHRWSPAAGLSCTDCAAPEASPDSTTVYLVASVSPSICPVYDTVVVTVRPAPRYEVVGDTLLCAGQRAEIEVRTTDRFRWLSRLPSGSSRLPRVRLALRQTTTLHFELSNASGCTVRDSVRIVVASPPVANAGRDTAVCVGASVRLHATGGTSYQWSPSTGLSCDTCADPVASPLRTTTYRVVAAGAAGCIGGDSVVVAVVPRASISAGPDTTICPGESLRLSVRGAERYRWQPSPDLSCIECASPIARPTTTTVYHVEGFTGAGCGTRDSVVVRVRAIDSLCPPVPSMTSADDATMRLDAPSPNPVRERATARYHLPRAGDVEIAIVDARGAVRLLERGYRERGDHTVAIDARELISRAYELRLTSGSAVARAPFVVVR